MNDDSRLGRPDGTYFDLVNRAVQQHSDGRSRLMVHVMDVPRINKHPICQSAVHKITGHTKRWWTPRSEEQKHRRNTNNQFKSDSHRADTAPHAAHRELIQPSSKAVAIMVWFLALIPTLDHMPGLPFYQCPAPDRKVVYGWYKDDHFGNPQPTPWFRTHTL